MLYLKYAVTNIESCENRPDEGVACSKGVELERRNIKKIAKYVEGLGFSVRKKKKKVSFKKSSKYLENGKQCSTNVVLIGFLRM